MNNPSRTVIVVPAIGENLYLLNLVKTISKNYEVVSSDSPLRSKGEVVLFNWYEKSRGWYDFIKKVTVLLITKISRRKIVWTVHNKQAHENSVRWQERMLWHLLAKISDRIHILCEATRQLTLLESHADKIYTVPHGDYFNCYKAKQIDIDSRHGITKGRKVLLFLGQIRPYKNIEILINAFKAAGIAQQGFTLLICGKTYSPSYKKAIEILASSASDVIYSSEFVPDDEMGDYLVRSSALVAPYSTASSLNSGTLWMACSQGRTMILPEIGCVQDLSDRNFLYTYTYADEHEHLSQLTEAFKRVASDVDQEPSILYTKGEIGQRIMHNRSWDNNAKRWQALFVFD